MKKTMTVAFTTLFTLITLLSTQAQTPFFLNKVGAVAEYATKMGDGTVISYAKSTVTAIDTVDADNYTVSYSVEALDGNRNSLAEPVAMTTVIRDGVVEMAPNTMGMEITGSLPSYPATLSVGQEFEYKYSIKMMGMNISTTGKDKIIAREDVTTPAGTFDCYKIESDTSVDGMGITQKLKGIAWISAGIGNVKTEAYDGEGNLQMTQELISLK